MEKPLVVIKFGGSAITDKNRAYTARLDVISNAARQLLAIAKRFSTVLVHGAGSYGHIPVRRFHLADGFSSKEQLGGVAETKSKLLELETILSGVMSRYRVPYVPFLASSFVMTRRGRILSANLRPLARWLRLGCVPVVGGDIVADVEDGFSVLSGDQLASYLAIQFKASKLVFGTDVDGIFESDPKTRKEAKLLRELTPSMASQIAVKSSSKTESDVTGGMAGKITESLAATRAGIPILFVNLTKDARLLKVIIGRKVQCSMIVPPSGSKQR